MQVDIEKVSIEDCFDIIIEGLRGIGGVPPIPIQDNQSDKETEQKTGDE